MITWTTTAPRPAPRTRLYLPAEHATAARPGTPARRHLAAALVTALAIGLALLAVSAAPAATAAAEFAGRGVALVLNWVALCNREFAMLASYTASTSLGQW